MKRKILHVVVLFLLLLPCTLLSAEESQEIPLNQKTGFPEITEKPFLTFDYGASISWVNRLQFQEERSNFVLEDMLVGLYFTLHTENMKPIDSLLRVAVYYPLQSTFNKVPQVPKQTILYGFDAFYGFNFEADMWKYVRIEFAPGIHFLYQLSDNWHYMSLGAGVMLGTELPLSRRWTILINAMGSFDYANLGTNAQMFPFDLSWQYQVSLGVRYSKKKPNIYSYITSRKEVSAQ